MADIVLICWLVVDVNECLAKPSPCNYQCRNLRGNYQCICAPGQKRLPDGKSCVGAHLCSLVYWPYGIINFHKWNYWACEYKGISYVSVTCEAHLQTLQNAKGFNNSNGVTFTLKYCASFVFIFTRKTMIAHLWGER